VSEDYLYLLVAGFVIVIEPAVHGERSRDRLMDMLTGGVGVRIKGYFHESRRKNLVFGYGGV
jgi:hypothetical protein